MDEHLKLLEDLKFDKQLVKLNKKLKNKKVILYGAGAFFKKLQANYDLSNLNIIGISDRKYQYSEKGNMDLGYPIVLVDEIKEQNPDYVLITTMSTLNIMQSLKDEALKGSKIKLLPLVDRPFFELLKEVFV